MPPDAICRLHPATPALPDSDACPAARIGLTRWIEITVVCAIAWQWRYSDAGCLDHLTAGRRLARR
jgi:hypothetical protein